MQSTGGFNQPFYLSSDLDLPAAFTAQPPGYPLAIAFLSRLGIEAADAALVVSVLAYAAILLLVYLLGKRIGGSAAGAIALGAALLFVPLTHLGRAALSECLAVAVVLLFFLLLDRHLERPPAVVSNESDQDDRPVWRGLLPPLALGLVAGAAFGLAALWLSGVAAAPSSPTPAPAATRRTHCSNLSPHSTKPGSSKSPVPDPPAAPDPFPRRPRRDPA